MKKLSVVLMIVGLSAAMFAAGMTFSELSGSFRNPAGSGEAVWSLLSIPGAAHAQSPNAAKDIPYKERSRKMAEGEKIVRDLFEKFSKQQWDDVDKFVHPAFQSIHQDGARNKEEEIRTLKGLHMKNIALDNFRVTQDGSVMIVTYTVTAEELIDGKRTLKNPAGRLSVFVKSPDGWKWLAHANLIAIQK